ncbi:hypothetical protein YC2023_070571 [Brassica napus]
MIKTWAYLEDVAMTMISKMISHEILNWILTSTLVVSLETYSYESKHRERITDFRDKRGSKEEALLLSAWQRSHPRVTKTQPLTPAMYRTAARRLLGAGFTTSRLLRLPKPRPTTTIIPYSYCTSSMESPIGNQSVNPNQSDPTAAREEGHRRDESRKPRAEFQEEQARVLAASLRHVPRLGWTEEAMIAGSREVGVSPSIVGSFSRKEAALVENHEKFETLLTFVLVQYFMDECLQLLIDRVDSGLDLQNLIPSERVSKLVRIRLEMQIPYMSKWPQALSIQAHPVNVPTSFKQRAMLVDEIWHTVGDGASDLDWYVKRTVLGGVYSTTEIYMLTDDSPGPQYRDTWAFLDDRVKDAFDLKKSIQEAKYFAQDIGAGVGKSFQGLMNGVMQTMSTRGGRSSAF